MIFLCRPPPQNSSDLSAYLQHLWKRVRVSQLVAETHEGGVRKTTEVSMPVLPKEIQVAMQPVEAHAIAAQQRFDRG